MMTQNTMTIHDDDGNHELDYEVKIYLYYKKQLNTPSEGLQERAEKKLRILQSSF